MKNAKQLLIDKMIRVGVLSSASIIKAFEEVDRSAFVTPAYLERAYDDTPLPIGYGQTISQPTTVAFMLERLQPKSGEKILDVGSGSGWSTALLANLVGPKGSVIGVELIETLVKFGRVNLGKYNYNHAKIIKTEEDMIGYEQEAPYDKILVSAAAQAIPEDLINQLKIGGIMVLPVKSSILKVEKTTENDYEYDEYHGFSFVPLVGENTESDF